MLSMAILPRRRWIISAAITKVVVASPSDSRSLRNLLPGLGPSASIVENVEPVREESAVMTRAAHVPYTVEQDEDGIWCAHAQLRPGVGGNG